MGLCASVSLPTEQFRLSATLDARPNARVELERVVPLESTVMPFLWLSGIDPETGIERLRADPDVAGVDAITESRNGVLAGVDWREGHPLLDALADTDASCLRGVATAEGWQLSLRFPSRDQLADCYRRCSAAGVPLTVDRIHTTAWSSEGSHEPVLTDIQRETLLAALNEGYFAVPRTTTLQELSREFGVSDTAISQRIRRGVARLLSAELVADRPTGRPVSSE